MRSKIYIESSKNYCLFAFHNSIEILYIEKSKKHCLVAFHDSTEQLYFESFNCLSCLPNTIWTKDYIVWSPFHIPIIKQKIVYNNQVP